MYILKLFDHLKNSALQLINLISKSKKKTRFPVKRGF